MRLMKLKSMLTMNVALAAVDVVEVDIRFVIFSIPFDSIDFFLISISNFMYIS